MSTAPQTEPDTHAPPLRRFIDPAYVPLCENLAQVRERVATAYDGRGQVDLQSAPGQGTVIRIHLPAPNPANASCPAGFFIASVSDGPGAGLTPGAFGMELLEGVPGGQLTTLDTLAQAIGLARHHVHHPIAGRGGGSLQLAHEKQLLVPEEALEAGAELIGQRLAPVLQPAQPEDQVDQAGEDQGKDGKQPGKKGG